MTALTTYTTSLSSLDDQVRATLESSISENTARAYRRTLKEFGNRDFTENNILAFLQERSLSKSLNTVKQDLAAITFYLKMKDNQTTTVAGSVMIRQFIKGLSRMKAGTLKKAKPITEDIIKNMVDKADCLRDKALLLIGWAAALRRSEIAALKVADIEIKPEGMVLTIRKSKTDQTGVGQTVAVLRAENRSYCPVSTIIAWIEKQGLSEADLLFAGRHRKQLSGQAVTNIIKKYAGPDFSAHGLRSGFMTSAANKGADLLKITEVSRHKDLRVAMGYIKEADKFNHHAGCGLL